MLIARHQRSYNTCQRGKDTHSYLYAYTPIYIILQTLHTTTDLHTNAYKQTQTYLQTCNLTNLHTYNPTPLEPHPTSPTLPYTFKPTTHTYYRLLVVFNEKAK